MLLRFAAIGVLALCACDEDGGGPAGPSPKDPETAPRVAIDRFSAAAGTDFVRNATNGLPGPNEPIDFDALFLNQGFGPGGEIVRYYGFDVRPEEPADLYALFTDGGTEPVQPEVVDVVPGDAGYNDFWRIYRVTVPADYVPNTLTSVEAILASGYPIEERDFILNCPVVPEGSTAELRYEEDGETEAEEFWYRDQIAHYFEFVERQLTVPAELPVPVSDIYVTFNVNPDAGNPDSGPASGFVVEQGTPQTHNVAATLPDQAGYSPLWEVQVYDNADFASVTDLATAEAATLLVPDAAYVNCPIVDVQ
jgi:hypothetical protein